MLFSLLVRVPLLAAGTVAAWFVARDAPNFEVVEGMIAVLGITLVVVILAVTRRR